MIEGRVKSVENKNIRFKKTIQMFGVKIDKSQDKNNPLVQESQTNFKCDKDDNLIHKQPEMVNHLKRIREKEAAKLERQKNADENRGSKASKATSKNKYTTGDDKTRIPLGLINQQTRNNMNSKSIMK